MLVFIVRQKDKWAGVDKIKLRNKSFPVESYHKKGPGSQPTVKKLQGKRKKILTSYPRWRYISTLSKI